MANHVLLSGFSDMKLTDFRYHIDADSFEDSFIEVVASGSGQLFRFRFSQPSNLRIEQGFCGSLTGMEIVDISERQWDDIGIEVRNFEQDPAITFFAKSMEIVDISNVT